MEEPFSTAIAAIPAGAWAVGVSGGADSVALLALLRERADLSLHVIHLDHQTRGQASADDAKFVRELSDQWKLPCTMAWREEIEPALGKLPANHSALFRELRLALFRRVVAEHGLQGVLLAHHADDQAETVLLRLLRGSSVAALAGMSGSTTIGGLLVRRPLLSISRPQLRELLALRELTWREDTSNTSNQYLRNRLRKILAGRPAMTAALLELADASRALRKWIRANSPAIKKTLPVQLLQGMPLLLAREAARRWLILAGAPPEKLEREVLDRLIDMANDAASGARQHFPGGLLVRRRRGILSA